MRAACFLRLAAGPASRQIQQGEQGLLPLQLHALTFILCNTNNNAEVALLADRIYSRHSIRIMSPMHSQVHGTQVPAKQALQQEATHSSKARLQHTGAAQDGQLVPPFVQNPTAQLWHGGRQAAEQSSTAVTGEIPVDSSRASRTKELTVAVFSAAAAREAIAVWLSCYSSSQLEQRTYYVWMGYVSYYVLR